MNKKHNSSRGIPIAYRTVRAVAMGLILIYSTVHSKAAIASDAPAGPPLWYETSSFTAVGIQPGDWFGNSIAGAGDRMVVGAPGKAGDGAAYEFERFDGGWHEGRTLLPADSNVIAFGLTVAMSPEWTIVGAPDATFERRYPGTVFAFDVAGQVETLRSSNGNEVDRFGSSVAIHDTSLAIGARGTDNRGRQSGSAYVFELHNGKWEQMQELFPSKTTDGSNFGLSIDIHGDRLIGGATDFSGGVGGGQAFIFEKQNGTWVEQIELSEITPGFTDAFGRSVAINDRFAIVGAPGNFGRRNDYDDGAVFVYEKVGAAWTFRQTLQPFAGVGRLSQFGWSVAIHDDWLLVGAAANGEEGINTGSGYLFRLVDGLWTAAARLTSRSPLNEQILGASSYIGDNFFVLGAPSLSTADPSVGHVQVFVVPEPAAGLQVLAAVLLGTFRRRSGQRSCT